MEVKVGAAGQNSQTLLFLHEQDKNNVKRSGSIAFVKEKNVLKKCTMGGYGRAGERVLGVSFLFPYRQPCYEVGLSLLDLR